MNDRELLEFAAKSAGLTVQDRSAPVTLYIVSDGCKTGYAWDPLTDDGDALRLAVKLRIDLQIYLGGVDAIWIDEDISDTHEVQEYCDAEFEGDESKYAATRRAIVRAAAEIGKAKS